MKLPQHVAIIMDGNGRWAKKRNLPRAAGHKNGVNSVREAIKACLELEIPFLTLYAFSTENWNRPKFEITQLMRLLAEAISKETKTLMEQNIRLTTIGNLHALPPKIQEALTNLKHATRANQALTLTLALSYSGRQDILNACNQILTKAKNGSLEVDIVDEQTFENYLSTADHPPLDLLIRTSGEHRISNFLLWEVAYSELFFTETLWPDFDKTDFLAAVESFQLRERRFGIV